MRAAAEDGGDVAVGVAADDGTGVVDGTEHSFRGLLGELGTLTANQMRLVDSGATFTMQSEPTAVQQRCFELLGVTPQM